jgi:hypothetical protein
VLSLADAPVADFTKAFQGADVVYFSAGAGGKGGEEMTKKIDYEGAVKVFDALEGVEGKKPLLILVSAIDVRDPEKIPAHYVRPYHNNYRNNFSFIVLDRGRHRHVQSRPECYRSVHEVEIRSRQKSRQTNGFQVDYIASRRTDQQSRGRHSGGWQNTFGQNDIGTSRLISTIWSWKLNSSH